jgi:pimeloyl-ACP methyl ester carboxylesterase
MQRHRWPGLVLGTLLLWVAGCGQRAGAPLDALIDVGTHRLHIHCVGAGSPTIVLDTGAGDTYEGWVPLIDSLAQESRICAYERAGYGQSDPGPMPRDSQRAVDELHRLLVKSGEEGPFLLLGHSLGALNLQVYAARYPEEAAGLVLLDPPPLKWLAGEDFPELRELFRQEAASMRNLADAAEASGPSEQQMRASFLLAVASEHEQLIGESAEQAAAIGSFGQLPLVVVGATKPDPRFGTSAGAFRLFWNRESHLLAEKSDDGRFILADGSSHNIHLDAPDLVIQVVHEILQSIRG